MSKNTKTKKCKSCKAVLNNRERTHIAGWGLFCDEQCIKIYEDEKKEYVKLEGEGDENYGVK